MRGFLLALISAALIAACTTPPNKFSDPNLVKIYDFADRRQGDSLIQYLKHSNVNYRAEACLAFASIQDSTLSYWLGNILLEDTSRSVRVNAAFALGQTLGNSSVNALIPALTDKDPRVVREVLEALGKTIRKPDLASLLSFRPQDSLAHEGMATALYRLGLRGITEDAITQKAAEYLKPNYTSVTRLAAANFFARANVSGEFFQNDLLQAASDENVAIRMAAVSSLRRVQNDVTLQTLQRALKTDQDYRVRANTVRALQSFKLPSKNAIYDALLDSNVNVGIAASEVIKQVAVSQDLNDLQEYVKKLQNWRVRANVIESIVQLDTTYLKKAIDLYTKSDNEYEQSWLLTAMAKSPHSLGFISNQILQSKIPVIKSTGTSALASMNRKLGASSSLAAKFAEVFKNVINDGDAGVIGIAANVLSDPTLNYKSVITDYSFLTEAKQNLSLPKDIEALQPLEEAIAYFEGKEKPTPPQNAFNHPINWERVQSVPKDRKVLIRTTQGDITLQLLVEESPGSTLNFVDLIKQGYFNDKFFHRVVPNFVIQTGCYRGDGFGSEDYSIRSEFSRRRYAEGSVGMASAGKDTEGTQWFITHLPTPHLDGRYTIFATVVSGMEVGDKILNVSLL